MINDLDRILEEDAHSHWQMFCEWLYSFHDIDTDELLKFNSFDDFENSKVSMSLKYLESIKDLWIKWNKAVQTDEKRAKMYGKNTAAPWPN